MAARLEACAMAWWKARETPGMLTVMCLVVHDFSVASGGVHDVKRQWHVESKKHSELATQTTRRRDWYYTTDMSDCPAIWMKIKNTNVMKHTMHPTRTGPAFTLFPAHVKALLYELDLNIIYSKKTEHKRMNTSSGTFSRNTFHLYSAQDGRGLSGIQLAHSQCDFQLINVRPGRRGHNMREASHLDPTVRRRHWSD